MSIGSLTRLSHAHTLALPKQTGLISYAKQILSTVNSGSPLRPNQKLKITAYSHYLPLVHAITETAYKNFKSGLVSVDLIEHEFEELKRRYRITEDFDFKRQNDVDHLRQGGAFLTFHNDFLAYNDAKLPFPETKKLMSSICEPISPEVQIQLSIDSKEILKGCLSLRKKQPLSITASREHLPQMLQLAEWAYQNGTRIVEIKVEERRELDPEIPLFKYANDKLIEEVSKSTVDRAKEIVDKKVARLILDSEDPNRHEEVDSNKVQKRQSAVSEAIRPHRDRYLVENPWCLYYLPTTASASAAGYSNLREAAIEARLINRVGHLEEHLANLKERAKKINHLIKQGYDTLHFVSVKPNTETPDGKTDLKVALTSKSIFTAVGQKTPSGQYYVANVPSEECYSTPDWTKTQGHVSMTMPSKLSGKLIEGIQMWFKDGKVVRADATKNSKVLQGWISKNKDADKLGEVALVAGSPIFDLGRIHQNTLIDENATCHIALGDSYPECIKGAMEKEDHIAREKYMKSLNCNFSPAHHDFMIGGPNVMVFLEKSGKPDKKVLIKDNKFQI